MIALADPSTDAGAKQRLFLLEAVSPGRAREYVASESLPAMRLMRQAIENRLLSPAEYGARGARTRRDVIKARGQFGGFSNYPDLPSGLNEHLADFLRIANASNDRRQPVYERFVRDAITAATEAMSPPTAAYTNVTGWRTADKGSPDPRFRPVVALSGNTFFSTVPAVPRSRARPARRRRG